MQVWQAPFSSANPASSNLRAGIALGTIKPSGSSGYDIISSPSPISWPIETWGLVLAEWPGSAATRLI
jgi:hypothetical protein